MDNFLFSSGTASNLYDDLKIFCDDIPQDVINQLIKTLSSNYLSTINNNNKFLITIIFRFHPFLKTLF